MARDRARRLQEVRSHLTHELEGTGFVVSAPEGSMIESPREWVFIGHKSEFDGKLTVKFGYFETEEGVVPDAKAASSAAISST